MPKYVVVEKEVGQTPLAALEAYRAEHPELEGVSITYAGRLDPMASGKLLLLVGDECKRREKYDGLDKEYEFEILFGAESDTGDILGLASVFANSSKLTNMELSDVTAKVKGRITLPYPAYSSKTVDGVPLFQYALQGRLGEIEIPTMDARIYRIEYLSVREISKEDLLRDILQKIGTLKTDPADDRLGSDFRRPVIEARWKELLGHSVRKFQIAEYRTVVSSGTYIRSLVPHIAELLGTHGMAYSIYRTKIGRYIGLRPFGMWRSEQ